MSNTAPTYTPPVLVPCVFVKRSYLYINVQHHKKTYSSIKNTKSQKKSREAVKGE